MKSGTNLEAVRLPPEMVKTLVRLHLVRHKLTLPELAAKSGLTKSTLCAVLSRNYPISLQAQRKLEAGLGYRHTIVSTPEVLFLRERARERLGIDPAIHLSRLRPVARELGLQVTKTAGETEELISKVLAKVAAMPRGPGLGKPPSETPKANK